MKFYVVKKMTEQYCKYNELDCEIENGKVSFVINTNHISFSKKDGEPYYNESVKVKNIYRNVTVDRKLFENNGIKVFCFDGFVYCNRKE